MKGNKHSPEQIIKKLRVADLMLAAGDLPPSFCTRGYESMGWVMRDSYATGHSRPRMPQGFDTPDRCVVAPRCVPRAVTGRTNELPPGS